MQSPVTCVSSCRPRTACRDPTLCTAQEGPGQQGHHDTRCVKSHCHRSTRLMRVCPTSLERDLARDTVPPTHPQAGTVDTTGGHPETQPTSRGRTRAVTAVGGSRPAQRSRRWPTLTTGPSPQTRALPPARQRERGPPSRCVSARSGSLVQCLHTASHGTSAVISRWERLSLHPEKDKTKQSNQKSLQYD